MRRALPELSTLLESGDYSPIYIDLSGLRVVRDLERLTPETIWAAVKTEYRKAASNGRPPLVRLVNAGVNHPDLPKALSFLSQKSETDFDAEHAYEIARSAHEQEGFTLMFRFAHEVFDPIARLAGVLQDVTRAHLKANLYMTPPSGTGFGVHTDGKDVTAISFGGEKEWSIYDIPLTYPVAASRPLPRDKPQLVNLTKGNALHLPAGTPHSPQVKGEVPSLHVSFSVDIHGAFEFDRELVSTLSSELIADGTRAPQELDLMPLAAPTTEGEVEKWDSAMTAAQEVLNSGVSCDKTKELWAKRRYAERHGIAKAFRDLAAGAT